MAPRLINDTIAHLKAGINWREAILSYNSQNGRTASETDRQKVEDPKAETYAIAALMGIDLNKYDGGR